MMLTLALIALPAAIALLWRTIARMDEKERLKDLRLERLIDAGFIEMKRRDPGFRAPERRKHT